MTTTGQAAVIGPHWGFSLRRIVLKTARMIIILGRVIISISRRNAE